MPYVLNRGRVQHVIIEQNVAGQQMIGNWFFIYDTPTDIVAGNSAALVASIRDQYRAHILNIQQNNVYVTRYTMLEIMGTSLFTPPPGSCKRLRYVTEYDPSKREVLEGDPAADRGGQIVLNQLPLHECMRVLKKAVTLRRGFFEGSYHRMSPLQEADHSDTKPEEWTDEAVTLYQAAFNNFNNSAMVDGGAPPNRWYPCIWSAGYHWTVVSKTTPPGLIADAATRLSYQCSRIVGTQISRRYTPTGFAEGK